MNSLECSICCEPFNDHKICPRLLNCGHSFCSGCLEKLLQEDSIDCPTCRKKVAVPAGVTGLPKNFALLDVLLTTPKQGDEEVSPCESCDEEQHPATSSCLDCKENMCKEAARWHTRHKASRDHRVVSLEELKANPNLAALSVFCLEHNEPFRFFDQDCERVVCRDCVTLMHTGHKCVTLAKAGTQCRQKMEALADTAIAHAKEIKAAEAGVASMSLNLNHKHEQEAAKIHSTFEELHALLTAREQVLMNKLNQIHKTKEVILTEQRDRLHIFQACLESAVQRVNTAIKSPGDAQLLVARSDIASTLAAMETEFCRLEPQADDALEFSVDCQQLVDMINKVGVVNNRSTCTATTTAAAPGFARPGQKESFTITARDGQGSLRGVGGDTFVVALEEENGENTDVKLEDKGDGTYEGSYTLPIDAKGNYGLSVRLREAHIQGSPFKLLAISQFWDPTRVVNLNMVGNQIKKLAQFGDAWNACAYSVPFIAKGRYDFTVQVERSRSVETGFTMAFYDSVLNVNSNSTGQDGVLWLNPSTSPQTVPCFVDYTTNRCGINGKESSFAGSLRFCVFLAYTSDSLTVI